MKNLPIPRLDKNSELYHRLLPYCRLKQGEVWSDSLAKHRVGCLDAASWSDTQKLLQAEKAILAIQDPPLQFSRL